MTSITDHRQTGRVGTGAVGTSSMVTAAALSNPMLIVLFMATMTQPYYILLGPLVIGPYRLLLLIAAIPLLINWVRGKYGGIVLPDILLLLHTLWVVVSMLANGQSGIVEYFGTQFLDIFVAYLLGRATVRNIEDFVFFAKVFLFLLLFLLPFAILESTMGKMVLQDTFRGLPSISVHRPTSINYEQRMGLNRAMTALDHPIIYGLLCSAAVSFGLVGLKHAGKTTGLIRRVALSTGSLAGTFLSLSAGAFVSAMVQVGLIVWDRVLTEFRQRWYLLTGLFAAFYVFVDIVAARPPLLVMGRLISFSGSTAWNRYMIWEFGSAEVMRHPIFGMGVFTDWVREHWMPLSVDNYWLLIAMRFGLVGFALLAGMWIVLIWRLGRRDFTRNPALSGIRKSYMFMFVGLFVALATVAVWQSSAAMLYVLAGSSMWLLFADATPQAPATETQGAAQGAAQGAGAGAHRFARPRPAAQTSAGATAPDRPTDPTGAAHLRQGHRRTGPAPAPPPAPAQTTTTARDDAGTSSRYTRFPPGPAKR